MSMISLASIPIGVEARSTDQSLKTILLFSCVGLVVSIVLMVLGVNLLGDGLADLIAPHHHHS